MALHKHSKRTLRTACDICGTNDIYAGHDDDDMSNAHYCEDCGVFGTDVILNRDLTVHKCTASDKPANLPAVIGGSAQATAGAPAAQAGNAPAATQLGSVLLDAIGRDALLGAIGEVPQAIDRDQVAAIATEIAERVVGEYAHPVRTVVVRDQVKHEVAGLSHARLPRLIAALSVQRDTMLVGPAGTGKSYMVKQAADALGVTFYAAPSMTAQTGESKFAGYLDASGTYHGTVVYDWAKNADGGIICLDEIDNGNPNILGWWNYAIAQREIRFPNGEVVALTERHRVVATANTYGYGRTREFVGRNAMDAATKNRFVVITIPLDDALEEALVKATGVEAATATRVLMYVRDLRKASDRTGVNIVLSPRNSVAMAHLLQTDVYTWDDAVEDCIRQGMSDESWDKLAKSAAA